VVCGACGRTQPRRLYDAPADPNAPKPSWAVPIVVAIAMAVVGGVGAFVVRGGVPSYLVALPIFMSMVFGGLGVRMIQAPTSMRIARSLGPDAFGMQQYGPSETPTAARGRRIGVMNVVFAVGFLIFGVVVGRFIP